jgi:hypothetical protein
VNFGEALELLKAGEQVCRAGWHGKDMYLYLENGADNFLPCIVIVTPEGEHQPGWLASQADLLAEDWEQVEE